MKVLDYFRLFLLAILVMGTLSSCIDNKQQNIIGVWSIEETNMNYELKTNGISFRQDGTCWVAPGLGDSKKAGEGIWRIETQNGQDYLILDVGIDIWDGKYRITYITPTPDGIPTIVLEHEEKGFSLYCKKFIL